MKLLVSQKTAIYFVMVLLLMLISTFLLEIFNQGTVESLKISIIVQFFSFIALFLMLGYMNQSLITLYSVFLILFYIFQNGQLLLYAFDVNVDFLYVEKSTTDQLYKGVLFSNLCMFSAFAAAIFSFKERKGWITKKLDYVSPKFLYDVSLIGLIVTGVIAYILIIIKLIVWLRGGYSLVIVFESGIPSILGLLEALFPAFSILAIVSGVKSQSKIQLILVLFILWGMGTALMGDRTIGLGVMVIFLLMFYFGCFSFSKRLYKGIFYIGSVTVFLLIPITFSIRNHEQFTLGSIFDVFVDVLYELGFSFFPLQAIIMLCPTTHNYLLGKSLICSAFAGFFPESLDILGLFSGISDMASTPAHWIAARYQYGFGMDCSLNAEMYANFEMYGFLSMFVICAIVASMLKKVDYESNQNVFSQYIGFALLFGWFTLPRRRSYYVYNKIFWYVVVIGIFIAIMYMISKKRGTYADRK